METRGPSCPFEDDPGEPHRLCREARIPWLQNRAEWPQCKEITSTGGQAAGSVYQQMSRADHFNRLGSSSQKRSFINWRQFHIHALKGKGNFSACLPVCLVMIIRDLALKLADTDQSSGLFSLIVVPHHYWIYRPVINSTVWLSVKAPLDVCLWNIFLSSEAKVISAELQHTGMSDEFVLTIGSVKALRWTVIIPYSLSQHATGFVST